MRNEQVFTPKHVIDTIFEELEYQSDNLRQKHIIDNSCGDGAFLKEIVRKYINTCIMHNLSKEQTVNELETYIHGIEIDEVLYGKTIDNLNKIADEYCLGKVNWDVICGDAMDIDKFNNKMDYVVGNPPYCNVHDLGDRYDKVKTYKFANGGMTDLYLVFFEIGINMLNENGKLGYITPNSWLNSKAGTNFRNYLKDSKTLLEIYQYGYKKIFDKVNTYTCITFLSKTPKRNNIFICYRNVEHPHMLPNCDKMVQTVENLDDCMINGNIYLTDKDTLSILKEIDEINIKTKKNSNRIRVKNGFATLNDELFIIDDFIENNKEYKDNRNVLSVIKASNGEHHYFFYPYDSNGKPVSRNEIDDKLFEYLSSKALKLEVDTSNPTWWLYGRTQALNDVKFNKIIVNNLIRREGDVKISLLLKNMGVYSGFYVPLYDTYDDKAEYKIMKYIQNKEFVNYVKAIGKYKNGGYYTFSSKDLEAWLNFCFYKNKQDFNDLELNWYRI